MKSARPPLPVRRDVLWRLLVTASLPLLLLGCAAFWWVKTQSERNYHTRNEELAREAAWELRLHLRQVELLLHQGLHLLIGPDNDTSLGPIVEQLGGKKEPAALTNQELDELLPGSDLFETVYWLDAQGRLGRIGLAPDQQARREDFIGLDLSNLRVAEEAQRTGRAQWSDSYLSLLTGRETLTYCIPAMGGALVANTHLPSFRGRKREGGLSASAQTLVLDRRGIVLFLPDGERARRIVNLRLEPLVQAALQGKPGRGRFTWAGQTCLGSTAIVPETGWIVLSFAAEAAVLETAHAVGWLLGAGVGLGALLALGLSLAQARRLSNQLASLSASANAISQGHYDAEVPPQRYEETEQVAQSLRELARTVRAREQQLQALAQSIAGTFGGDSLQVVSREAVRMLACDGVVISRIEGGDRAVVEAAMGELAPPVGHAFSLAGTPCERVLREGFWHLPAGLAQRFPRPGAAGAAVGEGFVGLPINDSGGGAVGLFCCLSRGPLPLPPLAREALELLAFRAATELQRQKAEERQRRTERELVQAQKMEAVGQLAGGVAHDFNNILQGVLSIAECVSAQLPPAHPAREDLALLEGAAQRGADLVRQLLMFSRKEKPQAKCFELNEAVARSLRVIGRVLGEHILISFDRSAEPLPVWLDPIQLEQVLMNLSVNARDAMPQGGTLRFALQRIASTTTGEEEAALLTVQDNGQGIPPEIRTRIFEPFFTTKETGKGTGLGLATVYAIITRAGGSIAVESEVGQGTTFCLRLPLHRAAPERPPEMKLAVAAGAADAAATNARLVLVAEDDAVVRRMVELSLRQAGFTVLAASDGEEAWHHFERQSARVSLAIVDVIMPRRNGRDLAEAMWRVRPGLPVLFCSGYFTDTLDPQHLPPQYSRLLRKPFGSDELTRAVVELLGR